MILELLEKKFSWLSHIFVLVLASIIFYLSAVPSSGFPAGIGIMTKVYHIVIFFLLCFFLSISIVRGKRENKYFVFIAIIISFFYALTDEAHQLFVAGRSSSIIDILWDSIGILAAGIIYAIRMNLRNIKSFSKYC